MADLRAKTKQQIKETKQQLVSDGVRLCWVIYHDGGYTSAADSKDGQERSGWGMRAQLYDIEADLEEVVRCGRRLVCTAQWNWPLNTQRTEYVGCVQRSNNTAEMSAVPG